MVSVRKLVSKTVSKLLFRELEVVGTTRVSQSFCGIELAGESLRHVTLAEGDKLQVMLEAGPRTFTPFGFDKEQGRLSLLVHARAESPAAVWARGLTGGERVRVLGPRSSLSLSSVRRPLVLFGDETSFALGQALNAARPKGPLPEMVFEVSDLRESQQALEYLGLGRAGLVQRRHDSGHLFEVGARIRGALAASGGDSELVLTGKAQSIQSLRSGLRARPAAHAGQQVKAYWAPGKSGLD